MTTQDSTIELRKQLDYLIFNTENHYLNDHPDVDNTEECKYSTDAVDEILNLIQANNRTIIERCMDGLPEKKISDEDYPDGEEFADNEYLGWNKAIDQMTAHLRKLLEDV